MMYNVVCQECGWKGQTPEPYFRCCEVCGSDDKAEKMATFWQAASYLMEKTGYDDEEDAQAFLTGYACDKLGIDIDIEEKLDLLDEELFTLDETLVTKFKKWLKL